MCLSIFSACGEGRHCELQSGHRGQDSQPPSQLHVFGAVTPSNTHTHTHTHTKSHLKYVVFSQYSAFRIFGGDGMKCVQSVFLCVSCTGGMKNRLCGFEALACSSDI